MMMFVGVIMTMALGSMFIGGGEDLSDLDDDNSFVDEEAFQTDGNVDDGFFDLADFDPRADFTQDTSNPVELDDPFQDPDDDEDAYDAGPDVLNWDVSTILVGGDDDDAMYGFNGDDEIGGGAGDDFLFGNEGFDDLFGQAGDDALYGGADADMLHGEGGDDDLYGDWGDDTLYGYQGDDDLMGGDGDDALHGGQGADELFGDSGDDALSGGYGNDYLAGGEGADNLMGGRGDDVVIGNDDAESDFLNGGAGDDEIHLGTGDLASGGSGADTFVLTAGEGTTDTKILDFDATKDDIVLNYSGDGPMPEVTLTPVDGNPDTALIACNGQVMATVQGATGLTAADITVTRG